MISGQKNDSPTIVVKKKKNYVMKNCIEEYSR